MATTGDVAKVKTEGNILTRSKNTKFYLLGVVVLLVIGYLMYTGLQGSMVYYLTPTELKAKAATLQGQTVRVSGKVGIGSTVRDAVKQELKFSVTDGKESIPVYYNGTPPDTFQEDYDVVAEGKYTSAGLFEAKTLLVKCPSKYEAKDQPDSKGKNTQ